MKAYRDIATLVALQLLCSLALTHLEPSLYLIHLYQSTLYIVLWVLLFYMEDRWAYMIAMIASAVWLVLAYFAGILTRGFAAVQNLRTESLNTSLVGLLALTSMALAISMIFFCGRHWKREYSGLGKTRLTFLVSFGIVGVYYAVLLRWFWDLIPNA